MIGTISTKTVEAINQKKKKKKPSGEKKNPILISIHLVVIGSYTTKRNMEINFAPIIILKTVK